MSILENLTLADTPQCQDLISLLIAVNYYYNTVIGNIKHLNKMFFFVETIFGCCLKGRKSKKQSSLILNVIVKKNLISDQIFKEMG